MKFTLKRTLASFTKHGCTDLAAALTYYSVMSVFPMAIALISTLGLFGNGEKTTDALLDIPRDLGAGDDTVAQMESYINSMQGTGGAGIAFVIGLVGALWAASNYVNAFSRALNTIYGVREGRPIYILRPVLLLVTFTILVLIVVVALSLVLTGPVASAVGNVVGLGSTAVLVWNIAKWPFIALMVVGIIALLYFATPNVKKPKFRWFSSGAIFALVVWILASAAFGVYVSQFGNYNATYGALAGVIVGLLWVWLTNVALLFGAELDAEKERTRELESGVPAERRIQLPVRGDKGIKKALKKEEELLRESHELRLANSHQEPSKGTHQAIALEKAEQADDPAEAREHSATAMAPRDGVDRVVEDPRPTRADEN